ncbi:MAG: hypothetical protein AAF548_18505 [Actinomycetota bacterium]
MGDLDDQLSRLADRRADRTPRTAAHEAMGARSMSPGIRRWPYLAAAAVAVIVGVSVAWSGRDASEPQAFDSTETVDLVTTTTTSIPSLPATTRTVTATDFGVRLQVPADWAEIEPGRTWGGDDGFVAVDVLDDADPQRIIESGQFGTGATIGSVDAMGFTLDLILGTEQVATDFGEFVLSGAILETPEPVAQHDQLWTHIGIIGDADTLPAVLETVEWIGVPDPFVATEVSAVDPDADYDLVVATDAGIDLRLSGSHEFERLAGPPTDVAFLVGDERHLVSQRTDASGSSSIVRRLGQDETEVDLGIDALQRVTLLDAATVDGQPVALLVARTGGVGPDDTFEEIRLLDLETLDSTVIRREPAWEASYRAGFLTDGAVVLEFGSIDELRIDALDYDGRDLWSVVTDTDPDAQPNGQLVASGSTAEWVTFATADGVTTMVAERFDVPTGEQLDPIERTFSESTIGGCARLEWWILNLCSTGIDSRPVQFDLELGLVSGVPRIAAGVLTSAGKTVQSTFPNRHPCAPAAYSYFSEPDFLGFIEIPLAEGGTLRVGYWGDGAQIWVQGFLDGWVTNRLPVAAISPGDRIEVGPAPLERDGFNVLVGTDTDGVVVAVEFDGCSLTVDSLTFYP